MAKKIVQIPDEKLDLFKEMILLMGGTEKDAEKSDIVADDSIVKTADKFPYHHPRANIAVDVVVFGVLPEDSSDSNELRVFVRKKEGMWWLPSKFMHCGKSYEHETIDDGDNWTLEDTLKEALKRTWKKTNHTSYFEDSCLDKIDDGKEQKSIYEKTTKDDCTYNIKPNIDLICQLEAMSALDRDKRKMRVVSVPFMTLISVKETIPSDIIKDEVALWMPVSKLIKIKKDGFEKGDEKLAHDHFDILKNGLMKLFQEVRTRPIGGSKDVVGEDVIDKYLNKEEKNNLGEYFMLPSEFDASHLINIYNVILRTMGLSMERSNLKKLLTDRGVIKEVSNRNSSGKGGSTYRFVANTYKEYKQNLNFGFNPKPKDEGGTMA